MVLTKKYLMSFDIETVPDELSAKELTGCESDNVNDIRKALDEYHLQVTSGRSTFPRTPFHKVVAISYVATTMQNQIIRFGKVSSACNIDSTEEDLISWFFDLIDKYKPVLISFNGRSFDLPVLRYRAMVYGIRAKEFYHQGDKWDNYSQRYNASYHIDMLDALSNFGASPAVRLNEVCVAFGYPCKIGVSGGDVTALYDARKIEEIRNYCETDTISTYLVFLRYALHTTTISKYTYVSSIKQIAGALKKSEKKHLREFYDEWLLSAEGTIDIGILGQC